ncbi:protein phyllopod [Anopheles bellator]|uniref:protein phyllopod n=1 Tax=Anopheles bellator TaxID=139047 RepID=UPI00264788AB|nr:protein phyllopod [Anopheles bellator]
MSSASSSTAGSNAGGAPAAANGQPGAADGSAGSDGSGNVEQPGSSATQQRSANTTGSGPGTVRRKANVCLICGIYTNLSLNIFEPRNGPNIIDVIYEKYKFRAERGDNADKHICFSCNNWLINWYSLQNASGSRTYEPAPSTSRSSDSSNNRHSHKRTRHSRGGGGGVDKENQRQPDLSLRSAAATIVEQHDQVSSTTVPTGGGDKEPDVLIVTKVQPPNTKRMRHVGSYKRLVALKESNSQVLPLASAGMRRAAQPPAEDVAEVTSTTSPTADPCTVIRRVFEGQLIRMLQGQGTSVTREVVPLPKGSQSQPQAPPASVPCVAGSPHIPTGGVDVNGNARDDPDATNIDIVLSFNSTISEVMNVVPSLKALQPNSSPVDNDVDNEVAVRSLLSDRRKKYVGLTVSVVREQSGSTGQ